MISPFRHARRTLAALVTLGCMTFGYRAQAISVSGIKGHWVPPSEICLTSFDDDLTNNCTDADPPETWVIPLATNAGSHSVRIAAFNSEGLNCILCSTTQAGLATCVTVPNFPSGSSAQTATVTVPSNGGLFVRCDIGSGSDIDDVNYNP